MRWHKCGYCGVISAEYEGLMIVIYDPELPILHPWYTKWKITCEDGTVIKGEVTGKQDKAKEVASAAAVRWLDGRG